MPQTITALQPIVALLLWTSAVWIWMYALRLPAIQSDDRLNLSKWVGGTGQQLDEYLPPKVQWAAHNYNHLHEAPVGFYAVMLTFAVLGDAPAIVVALAWAYVVLRVVHSLVQILWNKVTVRFGLFALSSLCLIALILLAAIRLFA
jgi:hypothetical protein